MNEHESYVPVIIVLKSHEELTLNCLSHWNLAYLKWKIREITNIYPTNQRLFLEGIEMDDKEAEYTLSTYGIESISTGSAEPPIQFRIFVMEVFRGIPQTYFLDESIFDHKWDCSFEGIYEKNIQKRGNEWYVRPMGCVRYGVKVLGKYTDDRWLGGKGYRTEAEWPVAYHGTKEVNILDILRNGFKLEKGVRFAFGRGIYCTPDPRVAMRYAFDYPFNGKGFKLIIQCRVDPQKLQRVNDGGYWLVPDGSAIRPYGICVFPGYNPNPNPLPSQKPQQQTVPKPQTQTTGQPQQQMSEAE